jgi:hypothetical protein
MQYTMKSSQLFCQLPVPETLSILSLRCLKSSLYSLGTDPQKKSLSKIVPLLGVFARNIVTCCLVTWQISRGRCLTLGFIWGFLGRATTIHFTNLLHTNKSLGLDWTLLNSVINWTGADCSFTFVTSRRTEYWPPPPTVHLIPRLFIATGKCLHNRCLATDYPSSILWGGYMC